jgi:uncharacterized membrane protein
MSVFVEFLITLGVCIGVGIVAHQVAQRAPHPGRARLTPRAWDRLLYFSVLVFVAGYSILVITAHLAMVSESTDLAQFDQLIWNSLRGRILENTFVPDAPNFLGKSFVPFLLAFVPLYAVWNSPIVLLLAQPIALAAGAFPLYWFARKELGRALAFCIALAYLLSPAISFIIIIEFHEIVMATPLLAYATFFLLRRNWRALFVTLGVALLIKEEVAFIVAAFGAFLFLFQRRRALGFALAAFGIAWAVVLLQWIIPFFRGAESGGFYYFGSGWIAGGGARYGYLGSSLGQVITTIFTRPDLVLANMLTPSKIQFLFNLLVPLLFLPALGAEILLLAAPTLGYSMLSTYGWQTSIQTLYPAPMLQFWFFAATLGLRRVLARRDSFASRASWGAMLLTATLANYLLYAPAPLARFFQPPRYIVSERSLLGKSLANAIPPDAIVITQTELLAHVSQRARVYDPPLIPDFRQADFVFADRRLPGYNNHRAAWEMYAASGFFETLDARDGFWLARVRAPEQLDDLHFGDRFTLIGHSLMLTETLRGGATIRPVLALRAEQPITTSLTIALQVADARGHIWASDTREPHAGASPTDQWRVGKTITDQFTLPLPPTIPTGEYALDVSICALKFELCLAADGFQTITLARFPVQKNSAAFTASQLKIEAPLVVDLREMRLLGFVPPRETISPGELLQVGVYWRAREKPRDDYLVAIQLRDASGNIAFEHATRPANDAYPTTQWNAGEVLLDWHDFILPRELAPGPYTIFVALKNRADAPSLGEAMIAPVRVVVP